MPRRSAVSLRPRRRLFVEPLEDRTLLDANFAEILHTEHADLGINFVGGAWQMRIIDKDHSATLLPGETLMLAGPVARESRAAGTQWDFLGMAAGEDVWILPANQDPNLLYLGASSENTPVNTFQPYEETDPRIADTGPYVKVRVLDVRGPGHFSVWQTGSFGGVTQWVSTADGGLTAADAFFSFEGAHIHYFWGFSQPGYYEVDVQASAFRFGSWAATSSPVTTYHFIVDPLPPTNHVPGDQATNQDTDLVFSAGNGNAISMEVAHPEVGDCPVEVTLSLDQGGTLHLGSTAGLDGVTGDGTATVVLSGSAAAINAALDGLRFDPDGGFSGTATLTVVTADQRFLGPVPYDDYELIDTDTVAIRVAGFPVAGDETVTVDEDSGASAIDVLANDSDPDGDPFAITAVTDPTNGTAVIDDNGTPANPADDFIVYTPDPDFFGTDSFTYTISDETGSDTATVTVEVNPVNDDPTANDDDAWVFEDSGANPIDVLANDSILPDAGETLTVTGVTQGTNGGTVAIINGGTAVSYQPPPGYTGPDSFTYTIVDGNGGTATATVTIDVRPNLPPVARDDEAAVAEDGTIAIDVLGNDSDPAGDPLTITQVTDPAGGTAAVNDNGTPGDPTDDFIVYTPAPGFSGDDRFTYTTGDGHGGTATATVTVHVVPNLPPTAVDDPATVDEDSGATPLDVLANDSDPEDDPLTITQVTDPANGTAVIDNNGTPANPADDFIVYTPDPDFFGEDSFTYTVSDGQGGSATATVTVTVNAVNDSPTANPDAVAIDEDSGPTPIDVLANDGILPDTGETLTVTAVSQGDQGGTVAVTGNGAALTYRPAPNFFGTETFEYTVSDGNGGTATATVTVTVRPVNDDPTANPDAAAVVQDSGPAAIDVLANDGTAPDTGETLTITAVSQGTNGGAVVLTGGGAGLTYQPPPGFIGADTFTYTIDDGHGGTATATVTVQVTAKEVHRLWVAGPDRGAAPLLRVFEADTGRAVGPNLLAFDESYRGGVVVAVADLNGDGHPEIVAGMRRGREPKVRVFNGVGFGPMPQFDFGGDFQPFAPGTTRGLYVGAGDVDDDGVPDILVGTGRSPVAQVKAFSGADGTELFTLLVPGRAFRKGVRVTAGEFTGDDRDDVVAGSGKGSWVRVFDSATLVPVPGKLGKFRAFGAGYSSGVWLASGGDVNGDGQDDLVAGKGSGPATVRLFDGASGDRWPGFRAFALAKPRPRLFVGDWAAPAGTGVRVGLIDVDGDGQFEVLTGAGPKEKARVRLFALDGVTVQELDAFHAAFSHDQGIFVAGAL